MHHYIMPVPFVHIGPNYPLRLANRSDDHFQPMAFNNNNNTPDVNRHIF